MRYVARVLTSTAALREDALRWNDLWLRSTSARPVDRAEPVAHWIDHFAPGAAVRAVVVEEQAASGDSAPPARWLAAMPLVERRLPLGQSIGVDPYNHWASCGQLLLDPAADDGAVDVLAGAVGTLGWPMLWLQRVPLESAAYRRLQAALARRDVRTSAYPVYSIGVVDLPADWHAYLATRSKHHRANLRQSLNRATSTGPVALRIVRDGSPEELSTAIRRGFEVERSSWKGREGTAVLDVPGLERFYAEQARVLATENALHLVFLEHDREAIAFEYGCVGKGCYFTPKVGYDDRFARISPGQLLRAELYEGFCSQSPPMRIDFAGEQTETTSKWTTSTYEVGNLLIATGRVRGRALLAAYAAARRLRELLRRG